MTRYLAVRSAGAVLVLAALVATLVAACGPAPSSVTASATASPAPSRSIAATGSAPATPAASAVTVDATLLGILPRDVDGVAVVGSPEGDTQALEDPLLPALATRVAAAVAVDAASGDFVYAVVVGLRPGAMSDAAFRGWRDSFDAGACSQAGGVVGNAEAEFGGRRVHIGSCAGGVHTYHVWLPASDRLVSASAVGARRFGERLVEGIRE